MKNINITRMLNESESGNFLFSPLDNICNIQIFDRLDMKTCAELIANMNQIITQLPMKKPIDST